MPHSARWPRSVIERTSRSFAHEIARPRVKARWRGARGPKGCSAPEAARILLPRPGMPATTVSLVVIEDASSARDLAAVPTLTGETNHVLCRGRCEQFSDFIGRLCARFIELQRKHTITHVSYLVSECDEPARQERQYLLRYLLHTLGDGCGLDLVTPGSATSDLLRTLDELLPMAAPGVSLKARSATPHTFRSEAHSVPFTHPGAYGTPAGSLAS